MGYYDKFGLHSMLILKLFRFFLNFLLQKETKTNLFQVEKKKKKNLHSYPFLLIIIFFIFNNLYYGQDVTALDNDF